MRFPLNDLTGDENPAELVCALSKARPIDPGERGHEDMERRFLDRLAKGFAGDGRPGPARGGSWGGVSDDVAEIDWRGLRQMMAARGRPGTSSQTSRQLSTQWSRRGSWQQLADHLLRKN
eukprot:4266052-Pyramimonas_sp.AAC.1